LSASGWTPVWLWLAIVASGIYHGINPGMGWPLAVAAGLMNKSPRALFASLGPLAFGHLAAMLAMLLPFAMLLALAQWQHQIQIGAGLLVVAFGIFRLIDPRHPRMLARIRPTQLDRDDLGRRLRGVAGLPLSRPAIRRAKLVQPGCDLGREPDPGRRRRARGRSRQLVLTASDQPSCFPWMCPRQLG
jgi:hypothetical protein